MHRLGIAIVLLLALAACAAQATGERRSVERLVISAAQQGAAAPATISWGLLRNSRYPLPEAADGWARLRDGLYQEQRAADTLTVSLANLVAFGDLNGDGAIDAAVLLTSATGAAALRVDLAAVLSQGGGGWAVATAPLGAGTAVEALHIDGDAIRLTARHYAPADHFCCPSRLERGRYLLAGDRLALVERHALALNTAPLDLARVSPHPLALTPERAQIIDGIVGPHAADAYLVRGVAGQRLAVSLHAAGARAQIGIAAPTGHGALLELAAGRQAWEGELPAGGAYLIYVAADGANSAYRLEARLSAPPPPADDRLIYLTFDDGPDPTYTPQVLALLERYGAQATFFVIGRSAAAHPELLQAIVAAGSTLGNHTYSHLSLAGVGRERTQHELLRAQAAMGGMAAPCMRPPYGAEDQHTATYAAELGMSVVRWDIDPSDWARPGAAAIAAHVLARARPGSVILLHDGGGDRSQTVAALETILGSLSAQGYRFAPRCR